MKKYRFDGSRKFSIKGFDCADKGEFSERHEAIEEFVANLEKINQLQQKLFAEQKEGIIFVFQAMDAAGKDGAVRAVLSCLSPQGVSEHSFKVPSSEENRHDYLWRFWDALPEKGSISIFNRSYYEDVLVQKVHRIYEKNKYADRIDRDTIIEKRYEQIRGFERYLWDNSIRVVKIFLNVSKEEQAKRFISRIDTPKKNWKFSSGDIDEREYWDEYMAAYEICINKTARPNAPWYVVPADHKWYARLIISRIVLAELESMSPAWPVLGDDEKEKLAGYRELLASQITPCAEEPEDDGRKVRPSDTAVGIALKSDRAALSEKKFRKLLERSIFDNFSEKFGVSEQTREALGVAYFAAEESEAAAEADALDSAKALYAAEKVLLKSKLAGCGKEGRKLYEKFKKAARACIDALVDDINLSYIAYEETIKQLMSEYELAVSEDGVSADMALADYETKLAEAYRAHREAADESLEKTEADIAAIADKYIAVADVFHQGAAEVTECAEDAEECADESDGKEE